MDMVLVCGLPTIIGMGAGGRYVDDSHRVIENGVPTTRSSVWQHPMTSSAKVALQRRREPNVH